jgi:tRNA (adenine22-N1)-methyltransferase
MDRLSERLLLIAKQVNEKDIICDIGTDHAMIPIYLAKGNLITKSYACDIAEKPLSQAKKNIAKYHAEELITPILADGLAGVSDINIDTCIISGLGSATILTILQQDSDLIDRYILCPNDDPFLLRE